MHRLPKYLLFFFVIAVACCDRHTAAWGDLDRADAIMESAPDSALAILSEIDASALGSKEERARYALLMSMALDKNYIDTTTFDILQPAIDYYPKHGTPDERLRTYYYQGRIYQNQGEDGKAIALLHDAINLDGTATDTLTLARAYVSHGTYMYKMLMIESFNKDNLKAANLYNAHGNISHSLMALKRALNGSTLLKDKNTTDSILKVIEGYPMDTKTRQEFLNSVNLEYILAFGDSSSIVQTIYNHDKESLSEDDILNIIQWYSDCDMPNSAMEYLMSLDALPYNKRSMRHLILGSEIKEKMGHYQDALNDFKLYYEMEDSLNNTIKKNELQFAEQRHVMEIEATNVSDKLKSNIYVLVTSLSLLIVLIIILWHRLREIKIKRREIENKNTLIKSKLDQKIVEHDELVKKISLIEREYADLTESQKNNEGPNLIDNILHKRAEMINTLLVGYITESPQTESKFIKWAKRIVSDKEIFINDTRSVVNALYPHLIQHLEEKNLTDNEINYLCLYAIGMSGKEIGIYMKKPGHYNLSSTIRQKLGLGSHDTNIGTYIRNFKTKK